MQHIPYHGGGPAITALLAGDIQIMFAGVEGMAQVKASKLRALAVSTAERSEMFSALPTVAESGVPGFDVETWYGLYLPAGTPSEIVDLLNQAVNQVLQPSEIKQRFRKLGFEVTPGTSKQFADFTQAELKKWRLVVQAAGAKLD